MKLLASLTATVIATLLAGCSPGPRPAPGTTPGGGAGTAPVVAPDPAPAGVASGDPATTSSVQQHGHTNPAGQALTGAHQHDGVGEHLHPATGGALTVAEAKQRAAQSDYFAELAQVHLKFNNVAAAVLSLEKAVELGRSIGNENAMLYRQLGEAYRRKGDAQRYQAALGIAMRVYTTLHQDPERAKAANYYREQLSVVCRELGDGDRSLWWADRIGEGEDASLQVLAVKAKLYRMNGKGERAIGMLEEAEKKAEPELQEAISLEIAGLQLDARENKPAIGRLVALMKGATNENVQKQAKRLLINIYDKLGQLDKLELGDLDLGKDDAKVGGTGSKDGSAEGSTDTGSKKDQ